MTKPLVRRALVIPDLHFPFQCRRGTKIIDKLLAGWRWEWIVQLGDFVDWWQLSNYDKNPERKDSALDDIEAYRKAMLKWQTLAAARNGQCIWHQLEGNHEDRMRRYIWSKAPALTGAVKTIAEMLKIQDMPLKTVWHNMNKWDSCRIGNVVFHHGHYFSKHTAAGNLDKYRCNFIQGHNHRAQKATNGAWWSISAGHLTDGSIMHLPVPGDWQAALIAIDFIKGDNGTEGHPKIHLIHNGRMVYDGKIIDGNIETKRTAGPGAENP